jgi:hypothetical protein
MTTPAPIPPESSVLWLVCSVCGAEMLVRIPAGADPSRVRCGPCARSGRQS